MRVQNLAFLLLSMFMPLPSITSDNTMTQRDDITLIEGADKGSFEEV